MLPLQRTAGGVCLKRQMKLANNGNNNINNSNNNAITLEVSRRHYTFCFSEFNLVLLKLGVCGLLRIFVFLTKKILLKVLYILLEFL
jgi:hypothetical protein